MSSLIQNYDTGILTLKNSSNRNAANTINTKSSQPNVLRDFKIKITSTEAANMKPWRMVLITADRGLTSDGRLVWLFIIIRLNMPNISPKIAEYIIIRKFNDAE